MEMKATVIQLKPEMLEQNPKLKLWAPIIKFLMVTRAEVERCGLRVVCAFSEAGEKTVCLIPEDLAEIPDEAIGAILFHEIAHAIYGDWDEEKCDEFARLHTSPELVDTARAATEQLVKKLRSKIDWENQMIFDGSDQMWCRLKAATVGTRFVNHDDDDEVVATVVYNDPKAGCIIETRVNGEVDTVDHYDYGCKISQQVY